MERAVIQTSRWKSPSGSRSKRQIWRRRATVAIILLVVWSVVAREAARLLIVSEPLVHADAIVVLSGSGTYKERSRRAAALYNAGLSHKILLTNDNRQDSWLSDEQRNPYYFERSIVEMRRSGVPEQNIEVVGPPVDSTYDEAILLRQYCQIHALRSIIVVTSAYHSRRALWTFRHLLGEGTQIGLEPVATGIQTPTPGTWWLSFRGWQMVPGEYLKMIYYWFRFQ